MDSAPANWNQNMPAEAYLQIVEGNTSAAESLSQTANSCGWRSSWYRTGEDFLAHYRPQELECLVINLDLPILSGLQVLSEIRRRHWYLPSLATHPWPTPNLVVAALHEGACDFVELPFDPAVVKSKVELAVSCEHQLRSQLHQRTRRLATLTVREREVLELLLAAATTIRIANKLQVSPKTIEKHRASIMNKLDVSSVPELMRLWLQFEPSRLQSSLQHAISLN